MDIFYSVRISDSVPENGASKPDITIQNARLLFCARFQFDNLAAGSFDFRLRGSGECLSGNRYGTSNFTIAEHLNQKVRLANISGLNERVTIDFRAFALIDLAQIYDSELNTIHIVEPTMRQLTIKGHLTAFKTRTNTAAGASLHPFVSATGRFSVTAATTTAEAFVTMRRAFDFRKSVKFH